MDLPIAAILVGIRMGLQIATPRLMTRKRTIIGSGLGELPPQLRRVGVGVSGAVGENSAWQFWVPILLEVGGWSGLVTLAVDVCGLA